MINNPQITISQLADEIKKDKNAVNYQLRKIKEVMDIHREGSDKTGRWVVNDKA